MMYLDERITTADVLCRFGLSTELFSITLIYLLENNITAEYNQFVQFVLFCVSLLFP